MEKCTYLELADLTDRWTDGQIDGWLDGWRMTDLYPNSEKLEI